MRKSPLYILTAILLASACNTAVLEPIKMGSIALSLSSDVEVVVSTRADAEVDYDSFLINIAGTTFIGNSLSQDYVYGQMPDDIPIPFGTYVLSAQSCTSEQAETECQTGYGCVRYAGSSESISIMAEEPVDVSLTCYMVNAKASLTLDESFLQDFINPSAELIVGDRTVSLTKDDCLAAFPVYFNMESSSVLTYKVYGTIDDGTAEGRRLSYTGTMDIAPAKWAKIVIKSNHNGQIGGPDISVDEDMGENSFTEVIDPNGGVESVDGNLNLPSIIVDTAIDDAVVIDCIIDL